MTKMLLVYITCPSESEALRIGKILLSKRVCACINCIKNMHSAYYWPPGGGVIEEADETVLIVKTVPALYESVVSEVTRVHPSSCPCILGVPVVYANAPYLDWIESELAEDAS